MLDELPALGLDTSGRQHLPMQQASNSKRALQKNPFCKVHGFAAPSGMHNLSGPCSLACLLEYHQIGWSHLPKGPDGRPNNDEFVLEIMRWSGAPDLIGGLWGTSPAKMLESLIKAELQSSWYVGGTEEDSLNFIQLELQNQRPVIVLLDHAHLGQPNLLEWQVVFQMDAHSVYTKTNLSKNHTRQWSKSDFGKLLNNSIPGCNRTLITALK